MSKEELTIVYSLEELELNDALDFFEQLKTTAVMAGNRYAYLRSRLWIIRIEHRLDTIVSSAVN